jgi:hypothetical protein
MASGRLPPKFTTLDNVDDERRYRKQHLAAAFRLRCHVLISSISHASHAGMKA